RADGAALHPHGPRRRLPLHRARRVARVSLRAGLLLALSYVLLLAILALLVPLVVSVRDRVDAEVRSQARGEAELVATTAADTQRPQTLVGTAGRRVRGRVILVAPRGRVTADSSGTQSRGQDFSNRPEIAGVLNGSPVVQQERMSQTLGQRILATAVPI